MTMMTYKEFEDHYFEEKGEEKPKFFVPNRDEIKEKYSKYVRDNIQVGDGATVCYYTDRHAYTVIRRTAKTLTLRRCKATLSPDFKPDFIIGGFCAHCTNQNEQEWTYEEDENGDIMKAHWSEKNRAFYCNRSLRVIPGRHEFYDYNM